MHSMGNDEHAIEICKRLLSFLPSNNTEDPPFLASEYESEVADEARVPGQVVDVRGFGVGWHDD